MNDAVTLSFYKELIIFQHDLSRTEVLFPNPSNAEQRTIQTLAHSLNLVFEYTLQSRSARVVRQQSHEMLPPPSNQEFEPEISQAFQVPAWGLDFDMDSGMDFDLLGLDYSTNLDEIMAGISEFPQNFGVDASTDLLTTTKYSSSSQPTSTCKGSSLENSQSIPLNSSSPPWDDMLCLSPSLPAEHSKISPGPDFTMPISNGESLIPNQASNGSMPPPNTNSSLTDLHNFGLCPLPQRRSDIADSVSQLARPERLSALVGPDAMHFCDPLQTSADGLSYSQHHFGSRSGSVSSVQSHRSHRPQSRVQKIFRRQSSVNSTASSGYREIIFDSNSTHSAASRSSVGSAASGRRAPLSDIARAGYNIMRKLGACWRCKFLRKTVSAASLSDPFLIHCSAIQNHRALCVLKRTVNMVGPQWAASAGPSKLKSIYALHNQNNLKMTGNRHST